MTSTILAVAVCVLIGSVLVRALVELVFDGEPMAYVVALATALIALGAYLDVTDREPPEPVTCIAPRAMT